MKIMKILRLCLLLCCLLTTGYSIALPDKTPENVTEHEPLPEKKNKWQLQKNSENGGYNVLLSCNTPPTVNQFQECQLTLTDSAGNTLKPLSISMDGGMPAHGHGLPTTPELVATKIPGVFHIKGLKYNMPGRWLLGFLVDIEVKEKEKTGAYTTNKQSEKFIMEFIL